MQSFLTKPCTPCCSSQLLPDFPISFSTRPITSPNHFEQRVFKSEDRINQEQVQNAIFSLQVALNTDMSSDCLLSGLIFPQQAPSWKAKVNRKRQFIKQVILNHGSSNISHIARYTKASRDTVKSVVQEMRASGDVSHYEYNNVKPPEEVAALDATISQIEETFMTVNCIKRIHPTFSRKKILQKLHDKGYRYRLMPKERKTPLNRRPNSTRVCRLISHIAQAICDPNTTLLYIDEMKFPLVQTAERRWTHQDTPREHSLVYNRRPVNDTTLTAIAMCSVEKFEAVQIFQNEVTGSDFLHFLVEALKRMPANKNYTIIADNATWHHAKVVMKSKAADFLYFNEPKLFQLNIIENAFSYVRHAFRIRPTVDSVEEEARNIINIFFERENLQRFKGYLRQHLRNLQDFLQEHKLK